MVNIFGLNGNASPDVDARSIGWSGIDIPDSVKPYVQSISHLRDELRAKARSKDGLSVDEVQRIVEAVPAVEEEQTSAPSSKSLQELSQKIKNDTAALQASPNLAKDVLALTDRIRDVDLWEHDVYLEDRDNEPTLVRPLTGELRASRQEKENRERQKQEAKEARLKQEAER